MEFVKIVFLVVLFVFLNSCNDSPTKPFQKIEIVPLSVGNVWIYQNRKLDSNGTIIKEYFDTIRVIKDTIIDGTRWYTYFEPSSDLWYQNDEYGYRNYTILYPTWYHYYALYKFPGKSGEEFEGFGRKKIDSTDAIYITKIGSFKSFKYIDNDKYSFGKFADYYVSPGIGLVCRILYNKTETSEEYYIEYLKELVFYNVK